ncbi:hypothetical protein D3C71_2115320 [compost metagenome]
MITGYQSWRPSVQENTKISRTVIYAATGVKGRRYLPFALLQKTGTLHKLPDGQGSDLAYRTEIESVTILR